MFPFLRSQLVVSLVFIGCGSACAQLQFESEPINYGQRETRDPVARLQQKLDSGEVTLKFDKQHDYLRSLLKLLDIDLSSQVLVKSKTSFQLQKISPKRPRAVYFNDTTYVGWVQHGDVLEVMTTDPEQGEIFYTLSREEVESPRFVRDRGQCLSCHASSRTQGVPGGVVRSAFVDAGGQPHYGAGTFTIDHTSPFEERWGGWYVTGTHGKMRHMGNVVAADRQQPEQIDHEAGANVTDLSEHFNVDRYLTPHSDIVALMVLEHQTQMQNFLTLANFECRSAVHYNTNMNEALERSDDFVSDSTKRRVASVGDKLLRYLLFVDEFQLEAPVEGTSGFAEHFQQLGPRDGKGRSLRDLDMQSRMFKYPCSYLIYSPSFDALPSLVKEYVTDRLHEVLTNRTADDEFAHLSPADRRAILEILTDTKPDLWN